jgi:hypothetical protein
MRFFALNFNYNVLVMFLCYVFALHGQTNLLAPIKKNLSLQQSVGTHMVVRRRGSHIF